MLEVRKRDAGCADKSDRCHAVLQEGEVRVAFKSVAEDYKSCKARLMMMLLESAEPIVRKSLPRRRTGRKWKVTSAVDVAQEALMLKEVMG